MVTRTGKLVIWAGKEMSFLSTFHQQTSLLRESVDVKLEDMQHVWVAESILMFAWGWGGTWGQEEGSRAAQGNSRGYGCVHYLDCGAGFCGTLVHVCQNFSRYIL